MCMLRLYFCQDQRLQQQQQIYPGRLQHQNGLDSSDDKRVDEQPEERKTLRCQARNYKDPKREQ
ncbi:hypothetical protein CJ030_MR0G022779 [Morella rubra]|uniref:Uncharacterized protein n=1 Tax=Morella rubra TaxID=262757 RepID=A0A6A1UGV2_9ROSI|nr:hypothetical protein CJ030_MR0G022779 [Morella rubra]